MLGALDGRWEFGGDGCSVEGDGMKVWVIIGILNLLI